MAIAARQLHTDGCTFEDCLAMPEDGLRYELFDGMLEKLQAYDEGGAGRTGSSTRTGNAPPS